MVPDIMPTSRSLKVIREQRHLALPDVAAFANISPRRLEAFEEGRQEPSLNQLEKLAALYGVAVYSLFAEAIPNVPEAPTDFRKPFPRPADLSPRGLKWILSSEKIAVFARQLSLALADQSENRIPHARAYRPAEAAAYVRDIFTDWLRHRGPSLELTGPPEQRFLLALRLFFESQGGVVNLNDAPYQDFLGFFRKPDTGLETIFINRSVSSRKAQLFTLAHEYAHAIYKLEGISSPFILKNDVERSCNVFATEFLAPLNEFTEVVEAQPRMIRTEINQFVAVISSSSLLSRHATAIRLHEAGYISQRELNDWEERWSFKPNTEKVDEAAEGQSAQFAPPHAKRIGELGYLPVFLAAEAVERKIVDALDVQEGIELAESLQSQAFSLARRRINAARS
jgi:Zn-dependent peptidase ImmA (M78 family)/transcriptional regulator with XRE-family HTH domain